MAQPFGGRVGKGGAGRDRSVELAAARVREYLLQGLLGQSAGIGTCRRAPPPTPGRPEQALYLAAIGQPIFDIPLGSALPLNHVDMPCDP